MTATKLAHTWGAAWRSRRPLCTDDLSTGLRRRDRSQAAHLAYVEANPQCLCSMLVVDIDTPDGGAIDTWAPTGLAPTIVTVTPSDAHAHAMWALAAPVCTTDIAQRRPLGLAHVVLEGLRRMCDGDPAYTGLITHNPLSGRWQARLIDPRPRELTDLRDALDEAGMLPERGWTRTPRARESGLGRNCTLFDTVRLDAYRFVRRLGGRGEAERRALEAHVRETAAAVNATFTPPLPAREVRDTCKSICKWIETRSRLWCDGAAACEATYIAIQSARGRKPRVDWAARMEQLEATPEEDKSMYHPIKRQRRGVTAKEAGRIWGVTPRQARRIMAESREDYLSRCKAEREAVRHYHDDLGHSWRETAAHFDLSDGAARSRAYRARKERKAEAEAQQADQHSTGEASSDVQEA